MEEPEYHRDDGGWRGLLVHSTFLRVFQEACAKTSALPSPSEAANCPCRLCAGILVLQYVSDLVPIRFPC